MVEWHDKVVVETWTSKDGRYKIEGMVILGTRQAYIPTEWRDKPTYGHYRFYDHRGLIGFKTLEEAKAFIEGASVEKGKD